MVSNRILQSKFTFLIYLSCVLDRHGLVHKQVWRGTEWAEEECGEWWRQVPRALQGGSAQEETQAQPHHLHHLPAARAGACLREVPLPRRLQPRGAGHEGEPARGPRSGRLNLNNLRSHLNPSPCWQQCSSQRNFYFERGLSQIKSMISCGFTWESLQAQVFLFHPFYLLVGQFNGSNQRIPVYEVLSGTLAVCGSMRVGRLFQRSRLCDSKNQNLAGGGAKWFNAGWDLKDSQRWQRINIIWHFEVGVQWKPA